MMCAWAIHNRCFVILRDRSINAYVTIVIVIRQIILVDFVHRLVTTCGDAAKQNHVYHIMIVIYFYLSSSYFE